MMTRLVLLFAVIAAIGSPVMKAATYTDLDRYFDDSNPTGKRIGTGESFFEYFEINANDDDGIADLTGYDLDFEQLVNARAFFYLANGDSALTTTVDIFLGEAQLRVRDDVEISINFLSEGIAGTAFFDLGDDGVLRYTITVESGVVDLLEAQLIANTGPRSIGVPDGGSTMLLLGFGFTMLGFVKRRLAA